MVNSSDLPGRRGQRLRCSCGELTTEWTIRARRHRPLACSVSANELPHLETPYRRLFETRHSLTQREQEQVAAHAQRGQAAATATAAHADKEAFWGHQEHVEMAERGQAGAQAVTCSKGRGRAVPVCPAGLRRLVGRKDGLSAPPLPHKRYERTIPTRGCLQVRATRSCCRLQQLATVNCSPPSTTTRKPSNGTSLPSSPASLA